MRGARSAATETYQVHRRGSEHRATQRQIFSGTKGRPLDGILDIRESIVKLLRQSGCRMLGCRDSWACRIDTMPASIKFRNVGLCLHG